MRVTSRAVDIARSAEDRERIMRRIASLVALMTLALGFAGERIAIAQAKNPFEGDALAIRNGGAMFRSRCAGCHGPDARGSLGPDLTAFWAAGGTDDRMFDIIRRGVPGTEMTGADPLRVLDKDIWQIAAYVRTLADVPAAAPVGDAANGARIFNAQCSNCHRVNGRGGNLGPDLSRIGSARSRAGLLSKLRGSTESVRPGYEAVTLVTREGQKIRGVKKNEDEFSIQIMDTQEQLRGYLKANLTALTLDKQSLMPIYGSDRLNSRDADDLLQYLATLRGTDAARR